MNSNNSNVASKRKAAEQLPIAEKKRPSDVPIFLLKSFHMIDTCDPEIACWSDDGETFLIKDPEALAKDIFPKFFKHSKFTSFVRQLNFYGFKKVKNRTIENCTGLIQSFDVSSTKMWKFRHEKFRQGRIDLLPEIKNANQAPTVEQKELESLRSEVKTMSERMSNMEKELTELRAIITRVVGRQDNVKIGTPSAPTQNIETRECWGQAIEEQDFPLGTSVGRDTSGIGNLGTKWRKLTQNMPIRISSPCPTISSTQLLPLTEDRQEYQFFQDGDFEAVHDITSDAITSDDVNPLVHPCASNGDRRSASASFLSENCRLLADWLLNSELAVTHDEILDDESQQPAPTSDGNIMVVRGGSQQQFRSAVSMEDRREKCTHIHPNNLAEAA